MELSAGQVAVVTGAASGIGRAMARRFAADGLKVVLADVEEEALRKAAGELTAEGAQVLARTVDVSDRASVLALADAAYETFGAVHVLCNNAGVGSGAEGRMWEHEPNDWKWAFAVNVWGVFHGIQAFVPRMIASGEPGHVVNTSSGDGGIAPLPTASVYAVTKSAVVTMTESLYAHLRAAHARVGASVLFPGPHMLRTGLWESHRNRPERYAKERPRRTPYRSLEKWEAAMKDAGHEVAFTPVEEVAGLVVDGIRADRFWMLPASEHSDRQIRARSQSMLDRANPSYLENFILD
ncbi:SDR family NAD(P)-dependent oxidoreductase [Streptomyces lunaelactis]|uniref:SDR family NAD(P)-dependent oxidoreductase n=1 Tax=Streptomyces lunaelactis TaxID=1535768 RepID=UPI0015854D87|nr:SDR family NAD(P)-dependent oxidoreductase [Streptomyces lunaelactis]NUK09981.1 SDR family NAD(P)-dependent oxidoreductase [Streptomyces lunaelactis]NUK23349.1 SDR family NAD(P)-dependent oxidoreductase [Streptomyces lunaelactis]NUK36219.1 SDR family NAD(P)-dependent oxidoreductase [Streptomyces lunaelactis]NUK43103.1 SDR family NAD(P)-dependent oxidoreductase [Streptomyces lunaelactis]NUK52633.1 SDR family NAD(P)-dependent oxidoreductase [Streptomyces lunaelactis]